MDVVFQIGDPRKPVNSADTSRKPVLAVIERNRKMIGDEECSDVIFLVGPCKETAARIPVSTCFLKLESKPFAVMFSSKWTEKEYHIKDTDKSVMFSLLRWIYCHELVFESGKLDSLLRLAHKYQVQSLFSFVHRHGWKSDHLWSVASFAHAFSQDDVESGLEGLQELRQECVKHILFNPMIHFESEDLLYASSEILTEVLEMSFRYPEISLFRQCLRWAEAECTRRDLQPTPDSMRKLVEPFIHSIAFAGMKPEEFAKDPCESGILTDKEQATIFRTMLGVKMDDAPFSRVSRKPDGAESDPDDDDADMNGLDFESSPIWSFRWPH